MPTMIGAVRVLVRAGRSVYQQLCRLAISSENNTVISGDEAARTAHSLVWAGSDAGHGAGRPTRGRL